MTNSPTLPKADMAEACRMSIHDFMALPKEIQDEADRLSAIAGLGDRAEAIANALYGERQRASWQTMDSAPMDGTPFVALEFWSAAEDNRIYARVYRWVGPPNFWLAKRDGVCIRPDYQDRYLWTPLPAAPKGGAA